MPCTLALASPAAWAVPSLDAALDTATTVALVTVTGEQKGTTTSEVDETLAGRTERELSFSVRGESHYKGESLVVAVGADGVALLAAPVGGDTTDASLDLVRAALAAKEPLDIRDLEPWLAHEAAAPVIRVAALQDVVPSDRNAATIERIACSATADWAGGVREWAVRAVAAAPTTVGLSCARDAAKAEADWGVRTGALETLGDATDPLAVGLLLDTISSSQPEEPANDIVVETAALSLGKIGDPSAVDALADAGLIHGLEVGTTAVVALGLIGKEGDAALARLELDHDSLYVRELAAQTRRRIAEGGGR